MAQRLDDNAVKGFAAPAKGNRITYDSEVPGFGVRVTASGARSFILNYRTRSGLERRYTIGAFPTWKTTAAREEAKNLKAAIRANGRDPLEELTKE
ncbi:MAG TPA: Arm DNA-binding domain-containing protein, partial [Caulobacteraceae bacterium]